MNVVPERAREACTSCRRSHKKCAVDKNPPRCDRCARRNTECSLGQFMPDETTPVAQQGLPALAPTESAPESWDVNPGDSAVSPSFPYPYIFQEPYYPPNVITTETPQAEYPTDTRMTFPSPANYHQSAQPAMNQDGPYDPLNPVFQ